MLEAKLIGYKNMFKKIKIGALNDHFDILGGGTVHSFKFLEYLKRYYDIDVYVPQNPKTKEWMEKYLNLDIDGLSFYRYTKGIGKKYPYIFLNISHWKAEESNALKKFMLVFFPQFYFPIDEDYQLLANSKYTKEQIEKRWKILPERIDIVYPPIMTFQFKPLRKTNSIIHVSRIAYPRIEADKGHRQMIETFKKIHDAGHEWTFHLVGQIQDHEYYHELQALASNYPIFFHINIPFKELQILYGDAKIYWHMTGVTMPNEVGAQEHFGMTIVEAMAAGCVPISLNTGGPKEIIENQKNGFLVDNLKGLESVTKFLIKNPSRLSRISNQAIKRAKYFDEKVSKQKLYSIISKTDKVSIIILCWNNSRYTKECVKQLYKVTPPGFELILVDNGSTDNTRDVINTLQKEYTNRSQIKCLYLKDNLGFAKGNNAGLTEATRSYVCYLNNDTLPQYGWLEKMIDVLEIKEKAGIVGARLYFPKKSDETDWIVQHAGITFETKEPKHIGGRKQDVYVRHGGIEEVEAVTGACMLVRKKLAKFNEKFIKGYYEDIDLCLRIREKGYKVYINHEAKLIHYEGKSQDILKQQNKIKFATINQQNKKLFHKLWDKKIKNLPEISKLIDTKGTFMIKDIEIGGGEKPLYPDYTQVDLRKLSISKYQNDARLLPFPSNSLDNICSCYMLQCLPKNEAQRALREWYRCLKPGGKLELHIPDLDEVMRFFISTQDENLLDEIYGKQEHELDYYQYGWTFQTIDKLLSKINFVRISYTKNPKDKPYALSIIAYKPK
jgi:GT2 family glycosyltransferase/glycosyltransferase involved in cell wall biosynthesis/predicted SAM-dependent methyltransferase